MNTSRGPRVEGKRCDSQLADEEVHAILLRCGRGAVIAPPFICYSDGYSNGYSDGYSNDHTNGY